jgi:hypothetical protein
VTADTMTLSGFVARRGVCRRRFFGVGVEREWGLGLDSEDAEEGEWASGVPYVIYYLGIRTRSNINPKKNRTHPPTQLVIQIDRCPAHPSFYSFTPPLPIDSAVEIPWVRSAEQHLAWE